MDRQYYWVREDAPTSAKPGRAYEASRGLITRITGGRLDEDFERGIWAYHAPHKLVIRVSGERITRITVRGEMLA